MKLLILTLLTIITISPVFSQEKKDLLVGISSGALASPYYKNNTSGTFYSFDFNYYLSKRDILSVNYTDGKHNYYDNVLATDRNYRSSDGTNSKASYHTFSVIYKYSFLNTNLISAVIGAGAGIMTHSKLYPILISRGSTFQESVGTDLVFPVRLEIDYRLSQNFKLGVIGGFYINPDYPILAYHLGPRLSYIIK